MKIRFIFIKIVTQFHAHPKFEAMAKVNANIMALTVLLYSRSCTLFTQKKNLWQIFTVENGRMVIFPKISK